MRIPRFVLALLLVGTPVATVAVTAAPVSADPFTYSQVSLGHGSICVLTTDHQVLCKGDNYNGYLVPDTNERTVTQFTRINLPNGEQWATIHAGNSNTHCGLAVSGRAFCWGEGRLGSYFTTVSRVPVQVEFPNDIRVRDVQAGYSTSCAIDLEDGLWCWGDAHYIGNGDIEPKRIPVSVPMPDNSKVSTLSMNIGVVCVTTDSNKLYCWGSNSAGQLGLGYSQQVPYSHSWTPISLPAPQGKTWSQLPPAIGINRICAITTDGAGYCAGDNYGGSFGNATYSSSTTFVQMTVPNNEAITSMSSGNYHTCLTTQSEKFYCIGDSSNGQFGTGTTLSGKTYRSPLLTQGVEITEYTLAGSSTCFLDANSNIWCMGLINGGPVYNEIDKTNLFPRQIVPIGTPTVTAPVSSAVNAERATVSGTVNPNGYSTSLVLEVSDNANFANPVRRSISVDAPNGSYVATAYSSQLLSLAPRTMHYVRTIATNALGATTSNVSTFTTLGSEPVVSEIATDEITGNEAVASFTVNPSHLATSIRAEFSTDSDFRDNLQTFPLTSAEGTNDVTRSVSLSGLTPRTRYFTRAIATNRLGTTTGTVGSFLTLGSSPVISSFTSSSDVRTISVSAVISTGSTTGSVRAEVSTSESFAQVIRSEASSYTSSGPINHQFTVTGLSPRTLYFVRVVTTNQIGSAASASSSVRTLGGAPTVSAPTVEPTARGASLQLQFDANGLDTAVKLIFSAADDADDPFEHFIRQSDVRGVQTISYNLYELRPAVTYFVTLVAENEAGTATSSRVSFRTPSPLGIVINNDDNSSELSTVTLNLTPPGGAVSMRVSNHKNFRGAKVLPLTEQMTWELLASDEEIAERTVYVQFYFRNGTSVVYQDDIDLMTEITTPDEEAPTVTALSAAKTRITAQGSSATRTTSSVTISARDKMSGVVRIETRVKNRITSTRVDAARRGTYLVSFPKGQRTMQIRVVDKAGNKSKWIKVTRK
jgi:alpha-tubulin suppressor-like RCC1 family protein